MKAQKIIETLDNLKLKNQVYNDAKDAIINYVDANVDDIDLDDVDLDNVYHDLANTQGGSWLVYTIDIINYFYNNIKDIDEVLFENNDIHGMELNKCNSIQGLIQTLVFSSYEIALYNLIYNELNDLQ